MHFRKYAILYRSEDKPMLTIESINLIATDPAVRGGRPCVAGTGLRVIDIAMAALFHQRAPGQLAADYGISLAEVHAALAYYYQHKETLDADIREVIATAGGYKQGGVGSFGASLFP
jgi:uncharacterized protein (DUF433 family)